MATTKRRALRRRVQPGTHQLRDLLEFVIDHEDYVIERYNERKEEIKKAEEAAEKKAAEKLKEETFFKKKFTFGQMLFWMFIIQIVLMLTWTPILVKVMG